jgi:hypothetical protein
MNEGISGKAYYRCKKNPKSNAWMKITEAKWALLYCRFIDNKPEVRKFINTKETALEYCSKIGHDPMVSKYI